MKVSSSRKLSLPITFLTAQLNTLTPAGLGAPGVTPTAAGGLCPQAVPGQERWGLAEVRSLGWGRSPEDT